MGVMIAENGRIYEGQWKRDAKEGKGYESYPSGNIFLLILSSFILDCYH